MTNRVTERAYDLTPSLGASKTYSTGLSTPPQPQNESQSSSSTDAYDSNRTEIGFSSSALGSPQSLSLPAGEETPILGLTRSKPLGSVEPFGLGQPTRLNLSFANPVTNLSANRDYSMSATTLFGLGLDTLHDALPSKVTNNPLYRSAEVAADLSFHWGPAVLFHEWAHYREGEALGWEPELCGFNWWGGMVCYHDTTGATWADSARASAAGMNNEEWVGRGFHTRLSLGQPTYHDAIGMLLPDLQTTAYMGRTLTRDATRGDDNISWARAAEKQGNAVSLESMFGKSLATDLASVDTWYAAYRGLRYIATGERHFDPLTWKLGALSGTFPKFNYFRTSDDEVIEGRMFLNPRRPGAVELTGAGSVNNNELRVGLGVHNVSLIPNRLSVSPHAALTFDLSSPTPVSGVEVGAEVNANLTDWLGLNAKVAYSSNDLLSNRAMHEPEGFRGTLGLTIKLP